MANLRIPASFASNWFGKSAGYSRRWCWLPSRTAAIRLGTGTIGVAGQVALDAVFPYARDHLHFGELWREEGLEPHKTGAILFWGTEQANTFIDIGETMDIKLEAVQAHRSQVADHPEREVIDYVMERARDAGNETDCEFAEAFRRVNFRTG